MAGNFLVHSMPRLLSTKVTRPHPDDLSRSIIDETWYQHVRERMASLFRFYYEQGLVREPEKLVATSIDLVELRIEDFTEQGQEFVRTGVTDRWLGSFDRSPSKPASNVNMLTKVLAKLRSSNQ